MAAAEGAKTVTVLRRLVAWSEKIFDLSAAVIAPVSDRRLQPRIPTAVVVKSTFVMFWARLGSLHALELSSRAGFRKKWLAAPTCSADTMGRVHWLMVADELRPRHSPHLRTPEAKQGVAGHAGHGYRCGGWSREPHQFTCNMAPAA